MTAQAATLYQKLTGRPGYRDRPSQQAMIDLIVNVLAPPHLGMRVGCIEAPTGTGKSLAYLLGTVPTALAEGRPVIIATASVALQEQLLRSEIPSAAPIVGETFTSAVGKGRRRYVCDHALISAGARDPSQGDLDLEQTGDALRTAVWDAPPTEAQRNQIEALVLARSQRAWAGDLDAPPLPLDSVVVQKITMGVNGCAGRGCDYFTRCAYRQAKADTMAANVVVTNHALLLQDLSLGGGIALPSLEEAIVVIDEAHHLPENAVEAFSTRLSIGHAERQFRRAMPVVSSAFRALPPSASAVDNAATTQHDLGTVQDLVEWWVGLLAHRLNIPAAGERTTLRANDPPVTHRLPTVWPDLVERLSASMETTKAARKGVRALRDALRNAGAKNDMPAAAVSAYLGHVGPLVDTLDKIARLITTWSQDDAERASSPVARWVESGVGHNSRADVTVAAAPVNPAGFLRAMLFEKAHAVILTSATLRTLGTFDSFASRVGLGHRDGTQYVALPSPFDMATQGRLVVPIEACDPRDDAKANASAVGAITRLHAIDAGTLVLFTSKRQLEAVEAALPAAIAAITQTSTRGVREKVLAKHKARTAKGQPSILLGLDSFSEGLDLPGDQCRVVIIARLPFRPPSGPIEEEHEAWLKARGKNYFAEVAMPDAFRRLVQRMGRLIRTEQDSGTIFVLDRRLVDTTYGRRMLKSLPPYPVHIEK